MTSSYWFSLLVRAPLVILATALMGTLSLIASLWDRSGRQQLAIARVWARMLLWAAGARVTAIGKEKLDPSGVYVVCPNHVSYMDTPVLLTHIPLNFRFLAKQELLSIPFIGGHLKRAGNISVPLDDPRAALRVLSAAGRAMQENGVSLLVFPEGGRSESGELREFKDGAAYLAIKAQVPLVPVALIGVRDILPMHSHHLRPGRVTLRIGDPIPTAGLKTSDRTELTARLHSAVRALLDQGHA
ncbi:MAG: lysophospholipid acyltransferase family protein [Bryobacteraceae bacterium]|jgi:1-acyl-sn-glycerol-3-phosphate acyltransferase